MKTIVVVFDRKPSRRYYLGHLIPRWEKMGFKVVPHVGPRDLPAGELAVLHVDKTIVPAAYRDVLSRYEAAVNGRAFDISRPLYSQARLLSDSRYSGPVIIKTAANHGGITDVRFKKLSLLNRWWKYKQYIDPKRYPIFDDLSDVPAGAWQNPRLIVERFCPEREGDLYFIRYWSFFGDRSDTGRIGSRQPIVKFANASSVTAGIEIPAAVREARARLKVDFGRIDFVVHGNEAIVLDVNKTLGSGPTMEQFGDQLDNLAEGIKTFC